MRLEAEEATRAEHLASRKSLAGQRMFGIVEKDSLPALECVLGIHGDRRGRNGGREDAW